MPSASWWHSMHSGLLFSANRRGAMFIAIRVHTRASEKLGASSDERKTFHVPSYSYVFLYIPFASKTTKNEG